MNNFGVYQPPSGIENVRRSTQINSINNLNNPRRKFDEMIGQGWGGNIPGTLSIPSPSPSPSPSSFNPLPSGNLTADRVDRAMEFRTCGDFCVTLYNLWEGQWSTQRICWDSAAGWVSDTWNDGSRHNTLNSWYRSFYWNSTGMPEDYFVVDAVTRSSCFPAVSSTPPSTLPPGGFDASDVDLVLATW